MGAGKSNGPGYKEIVLTWCIPGLVLVGIGQGFGRVAFSYFGVAMLSAGIRGYGRLKRNRPIWSIAWLVISILYLVLGFAELAQPS
jgi:hypothetical protein